MKRRLTTILAADIAGYSRLMAEDEEGVIQRLRDARAEVIDPAISEHQGRVVKTMGDGFLVEFASPVAALRAALKVQDGMRTRQAVEPEEHRLRFRVGINLGDVVIDGDDVLGDAVNIAARLESLSPVGGICISRQVRDQVEGRIDTAITSLGLQSVKNIPNPVEVWCVNVDGADPLPASQTSRDVPSVAVLPFEINTDDPDQQFLASALVEDVTAALGRFRRLVVISPSSVRAVYSKDQNGSELGKKLGAKYVVEGSVRRGGNRLRVSARLIGASDEEQVWANHWDRPADDLFDILDQLTGAIVTGVEPEIGAHERMLARRAPTHSLSAWELCQRAYAIFARATPEAMTESDPIFEAAIKADPGFALPKALLARQRYFLLRLGVVKDPAATMAEGLELAQSALDIDRREEEAYCAIALLHGATGRMKEAVIAADNGLALNDNHAVLHHARGIASLGLADWDATIAHEEKARRLSPHDPVIWAFLTTEAAGLVCRGGEGDLEAAEERSREAMLANDKVWHPPAVAALSAARRGDHATAQKLIERAKETLPMFSASMIRQSLGKGAETEPWSSISQMVEDMGYP
ncbi:MULTISPECIES: adenylate/guanylate cyclase domain-containing protein [unclassified Ruegeria]|uniref:adenylate/guanylate cyclase domain-containing protein n=1 Tax=unclassified Ruegeria TaxID=2625375 RepID=UPI001489A664|nr:MULTISPECIES: adenylate/guanylate cyclase domain-containing protein [unclassified Ruegeria]